MILLYTTLLTLLRMVRFLVRVRVNGLEKAYSRVALKTEELANQPVSRQGNSNKPNPCEFAKHHFELGKLVHQRDRLETKHFRWQSFQERFSGFVDALQNWKGKKLPYTFGVLDVSMILIAIDKLGMGDQINLDQLINLITKWING